MIDQLTQRMNDLRANILNRMEEMRAAREHIATLEADDIAQRARVDELRLVINAMVKEEQAELKEDTDA